MRYQTRQSGSLLILAALLLLVGCDDGPAIHVQELPTQATGSERVVEVRLDRTDDVACVVATVTGDYCLCDARYGCTPDGADGDEAGPPRATCATPRRPGCAQSQNLGSDSPLYAVVRGSSSSDDAPPLLLVDVLDAEGNVIRSRRRSLAPLAGETTSGDDADVAMDGADGQDAGETDARDDTETDATDGTDTVEDDATDGSATSDDAEAMEADS